MSSDQSISLNKYLSSTGLCSRREADKWIEEGRVKINGKLAKKGNRVTEFDEVQLDNKIVQSNKNLVYIALNKPPGITCTTDQRDPDNIIDFLNYPERIFPIGRLDKPSSGLILLTNDGDIVNQILRAENEHEKEYLVQVNRPISNTILKKMEKGVPILGTKTKPCKTLPLSKDRFRMTLTQGLNRQIRRMCEFFDFKVVSLKRVRIMNIKLDGLELGNWRYLSESEISTLQASLKSAGQSSTKA